jgi:glycine cleavage system H protein
MSKVPGDLKYTKEHEWARAEGNVVTEGITDYAQNELSDVVYVELPKVGAKVKKDEKCGAIEAVKAVVDLYAAVSGEVTGTNGALASAPETVNADPYGEGWMLKIRMSNPAELSSLLPPEEYEKLAKKAGH